MVGVSRLLLILAVSLTAGAGDVRAQEARPPRCSGPVVHDVIRSAGPDGEVEFAAGRRVRLVDLRPAEAGSPASSRLASWLATLSGETAGVREVGFPDRWGRAAAEMSVGGSRPVDVGEVLVGEGWALVDAGERDRLCRPDLLKLEAAARARRAGLWAGAVRPIPAEDLDALSAQAGRFAIVEGRVVSVGERRERTYLNFGRDWARDFSVAIPKRSWETLKAEGVTAAGLTRRRVRVRGTIDVRRAPTMDMVAPDMLEILDAEPARPVSRR